MRMKSIVLVTAASLVCGFACANGFVEELRILGPAFSLHSDTDQAQLKTSIAASSCLFNGQVPPGQTAQDGLQYGIPTEPCTKTSFGSSNETPKHTEGCKEKTWGALTRVNPYDGKTYPWNMTVCSTIDQSSTRQWHSNNPAIGFEYTRRYDDHSTKFFASLVRDSYGSSSMMLGTAHMWPLADAAGITVDGGIVGGVWLRTILNIDNNELHRAAVPYIFPALAITESRTGLGVNVGVAPKASVSLGGHHYRIPTTMMVQVTWLVSKTGSNQQVSIAPKPDGGLQLGYALKF